MSHRRKPRRRVRQHRVSSARRLQLESLEVRIVLAGEFTDLGALGLTGVTDSSVAWGDYNLDGDLDVLLTGSVSGGGRIARIYRNVGGSFSDIAAGLTGVSDGSVAWGDFDNDTDLDILLTGFDGTNRVTKVYRNFGSGNFSDIFAGLTGVDNGAAAWGDYDNDGDLDILLTGRDNGSNPVTKVYRNTGSGFSDITAGLAGVADSSAAWGDYDNDGDLDILLSGSSGAGRIARVYQNTGGVFSDILAGLIGVENGSAAWGDYDNDGALDILLTGFDGANRVANVYRNVGGGVFSDITAGLTGVSSGSAAWGDFDNDGDLDILLTGNAGVGISRVYQNTSGAFSDVATGLSGVVDGAVAWGDYDNDGDLDILLTGHDNGANPIVRIYQNTAATANTPPPAPTGLVSTVNSDTSVTLSWTAPTDDSTAAAGLTYNLRVGTTPGDSDIVSTMAFQTIDRPLLPDGLRKIVLRGPVQGTSYTLEGLSPEQTYYWSVQAIDSTLAGGAFSSEANVTTLPSSPLLLPLTNLGPLGLTEVMDSAVAWGDYDNDGDLDILLTGSASYTGAISRVYQNTGGTFSDISAGLVGVTGGSVAWGDYDNDGDLDILLMGTASGGGGISRVYQNNSGTFSDISAGLFGVRSGSATWGDYDNDGDLDILLTGGNGYSSIVRVYQNIGGTFSNISANLTGVQSSSAAWGDYDNDGDLDILLTGYVSSVGRVSRVYQNDGGTFSDISAGLIGVSSSSVAWGDYDNDGDLDILLTGYVSSYNFVSRVYQNTNGTFSDISAGLTGVDDSAVAWGDYDNDGDLDILLTGYVGTNNRIARVYQNTSGSFSDISVSLAGVQNSSVAWGDYDHDGDLDILLTGREYNPNIPHPIARIYRNNAATPNAPPTAPTGLLSTVNSETSVTLFWTAPAGDNTPAAGLSYNLRVGTTPGGSDIVAPMAFQTGDGFLQTDGLRKIAARGLVQGTSYTLAGLAPGQTFYWSVQAIDTTLAGGAFAGEVNFTTPQTPFTELHGLGLTGVDSASAAWGDYDNDGDLDILLTGVANGGAGRISRVYQNTNGTFSDILAGLTGVGFGSVAWGDYDNDGDLDILLTGLGSVGRFSQVYQNTDGTFSDISAGLTGVGFGSVAWGDYDNDGDLDILLTGNASGSVGRISRVYENTDGTFSDISAGLIGVDDGEAAWGDYDNDGDLDILLTGYDGNNIVTRVYQNTGGTFSDIAAGLPEVYLSSVAWGDYDNDGDLDILLTGYVGSGNYVARVYQNTSGTFSDISAGLVGVDFSSAAWGDFDNDGDLDILLTGIDSGSNYIARVYQNTSGAFSDISAGLTGVGFSSVTWGDYDNDGDLDILLTGYDSDDGVAKVYRNNAATANAPPAAPSGLASTINSGTSVTLSWAAPTDDSTPSTGLTYNLRVGTTPGGGEIVASMAFQAGDGFSQTDGLRKIAERGLVQGASYTLAGLLPGQTLYWSVQAIDASLAGGAFAVEASVSFTNFTDFGDAPDSYQTTLAADGARHANTGVRLGAQRDGETDAVAPLDGHGDGADEDGVSIPALALGGLPIIAVTINGSAGDARLYGWIDFNGDDDFDDAGEQIADGTGAFENLDNGVVIASLTMPGAGFTGDTFARFRVSTEAGLSFSGPADDGEVEDYAIEILAPSPATNSANRHNVDGNEDVDFFDILAIIADLRLNGLYEVQAGPGSAPYSDVDGNYNVNFQDILTIIAHLRGQAAAEGEHLIASSPGVATTESSGRALLVDTPPSASSTPLGGPSSTRLPPLEMHPTGKPAAARRVERSAQEAILPPTIDRTKTQSPAENLDAGDSVAAWRLESSLDDVAEDVSRAWAGAADAELAPEID
ncbi:MAG: FG-GAP-like repeat-containing protein [Pirellulaceae bacterium]